MKRANGLWKEYREAGGTLSFKEWINSAKKNNFKNFEGQSDPPVNEQMNTSIEKTLEAIRTQGYQDVKTKKKYIAGIDKRYFIAGSAVVVLGIAAFFIFKNKN